MYSFWNGVMNISGSIMTYAPRFAAFVIIRFAASRFLALSLTVLT